MRLGTCIALEVTALCGALAGLVVGGRHAIGLAGAYVHDQEAAAASAPDRPPGRRLEPVPLPRAHLPVPPPGVATVFGLPDRVLLAPLGTSPVTHVKINHGGTSLSLRLDFASGARAAFKPEQTHLQSEPRKEIAAYRIDRLLHIGHVPPARAVALHVADLVAAASPEDRATVASRLAGEAIVRDGVVRGELSWWIPDIRDGWVEGHRVDEEAGKAIWTAYLQVGAQMPPELRPLLAQLSDMVVFDVLIDNPDRWSGSNTKTSRDHQTLYFMDNTLSFSTFTLGHRNNLEPLYGIQVFSRDLVTRLRALDVGTLTAALDLGNDPTGMAPLLAPDEIRAILDRRDHILKHIDLLIAQFGADAVLAFP